MLSAGGVLDPPKTQSVPAAYWRDSMCDGLSSCLPSPTDGGDLGGLDRHALYESAVQSPKGDISYLVALYQQYVGPQVAVTHCQSRLCMLQPASYVPALKMDWRPKQVPQHLREDFCGTALISATWCRGDVRRTATGPASHHAAIKIESRLSMHAFVPSTRHAGTSY